MYRYIYIYIYIYGIDLENNAGSLHPLKKFLITVVMSLTLYYLLHMFPQ